MENENGSCATETVAVIEAVAMVVAVSRNIRFRQLPAKVSFESGYAGSFQFRRFCGRAGENLKLPPKHMILSNLAVNEAPHGFASPCEICRLPPKVSKYLNLAVNEAPHGFASLCKTCRLPPKVSKHLNLAVNTYETVQTNY